MILGTRERFSLTPMLRLFQYSKAESSVSSEPSGKQKNKVHGLEEAKRCRQAPSSRNWKYEIFYVAKAKDMPRRKERDSKRFGQLTFLPLCNASTVLHVYDLFTLFIKQRNRTHISRTKRPLYRLRNIAVLTPETVFELFVGDT